MKRDSTIKRDSIDLFHFDEESYPFDGAEWIRRSQLDLIFFPFYLAIFRWAKTTVESRTDNDVEKKVEWFL